MRQLNRVNQYQRLWQLSGVIQQLPLDEDLITPSKELLTGWPVPKMACASTPLPATLTLHYHLPVELHVMADALVSLLAAHGCALTYVFHDVKSWHDDSYLSHADVVMGDCLIRDAPCFTLASWLENDVVWQLLRSSMLQPSLRAIARQQDGDQRATSIHQFFQQLMHDDHLLPLFNYCYQCSPRPEPKGFISTASAGSILPAPRFRRLP